MSKFKLEERVTQKLFGLFFEIVGKKKNKEEFNRTICELLSPVERLMVAKRIAIIYLLLKGIDHRTICYVLKVSSATVSKYLLLMEKSEGVIPTFKAILKNEKIFNTLEELFNSLFAPGTYGVNWSAAWRRKFEIERKKSQGI